MGTVKKANALSTTYSFLMESQHNGQLTTYCFWSDKRHGHTDYPELPSFWAGRSVH